jgi:hypothetical protein
MPTTASRSAHAPEPLSQRLAAYAWPDVEHALDLGGFATLPRLLAPAECAQLSALYAEPQHFRSRVVMDAHGYGRGEYQYFARPLPDLVQGLRDEVYPRLVAIANRWSERLRAEQRYPSSLDELSTTCAAVGQTRPTPLLLKYAEGDYNRLHQDLYGDIVFPLQLAVLLSEPHGDFTGGEFVLTEQRPRMQSRVEVVPLARGDALIFAVNARPALGKRGDHRVTMRHGVSQVRSGSRFTLGVIFHDAR